MLHATYVSGSLAVGNCLSNMKGRDVGVKPPLVAAAFKEAGAAVTSKPRQRPSGLRVDDGTVGNDLVGAIVHQAPGLFVVQAINVLAFALVVTRIAQDLEYHGPHPFVRTVGGETFYSGLAPFSE